MADGGGWATTYPGLSSPGYDGARLARERFQDVLSEFAARLASPQPMRRETAVSLVEQMNRLARRMAQDDQAAHGRAAELEAALEALSRRLESETAAHRSREAELSARLQRTLAELEEVRASKRPIFGAGSIKAILAAAAVCATLCGVGAGVVAISRIGAEPDVASTAPVAQNEPEPWVEVAEAPPPEPAERLETLSPEIAEAAAPPKPVEPPKAVAAAPVEAAVVAPRTRETYAAVAEALDRGDSTALARLTGLAEGGSAKAQLHLARLYETGRAGVSRDLVAARQWTLRAAKGGDRSAMYNMGLFLADGDGGPQDMGAAAIWFRKAAQRGVVDAQYNLGLLYESGRGVAKDTSEAHRWFTMAANAGDAAAREHKTALERQLNGGEPAPAASPAPADDPFAGDVSLKDTQTYLAQQGYYVGPIDGVASPTLKAAAEAYMRDRPQRTATP